MFWVRYLTVLVLGTAAVWFLSPKAYAVLRQRFADDSAVAEVQDADGWDGKSEAEPSAPSNGEDLAEAPPSAEEGADALVSVQLVPAEAAPLPSGDEEVAEERRPLSLERIWQSSADVGMWGVVAEESVAYRKDGKKLPAKAPGGTLVEITKTTFTSKGDQMALCALWDADRKRWSEQILLPASNIAMFFGTRDELLAEDVERLMEFCKLNAALAARRDELDREAVDRNPYAAQLRDINEENKRFAAITKELTEERDRLTGAARNRVADELRALEAKSTEISLEAKRLVALYEEWKNAHQSETVGYMRDYRYRELAMKLRAARPGVAMFNLPEGFGGGNGK